MSSDLIDHLLREQNRPEEERKREEEARKQKREKAQRRKEEEARRKEEQQQYLTEQKRKEQSVIEIKKYLQERKKSENNVLENVRAFTSILYGELEGILVSVYAEKVEQDCMVSRTILHEKFESFSFELKGHRITIVPITFTGVPPWDSDVEKIVSTDWTNVGRIAIFCQFTENDDTGILIEELFVFTTKEWIASGIIGPIFEESFRNSRILRFAIDLIEALTYNLVFCHNHAEDTSLDSSLKYKKKEIGSICFRKL